MTRNGWALIATGILASYLTVHFWLVVIGGAVLMLADGLRDALATTSAETIDRVLDDCGYQDTPQGQQANEDAPHFRAWEREPAGTWPSDAGAVE